MEKIEHGGNLLSATQQYGIPERCWKDFSSNINPFGVPKQLRRTLKKAVFSGELSRYPDIGCTKLRTALSERHGVAADWILCTNGANEALRLALEAIPAGKAAIPVPSFAEYEVSAKKAGHTISFLPAGEGFRISPPETAFDLAVLGHPNNPTSRLLDEDALKGFLHHCGTVVLDEAFVELTKTPQGFLPLLRQHENLIIVRAFTKSLAIPGLRLGYALARPEIIARMKSRQDAWAVNGLAQSAAEALPELGRYLQKTEEWIRTEPARFYVRLSGIPGLEVWPPDTNFILCRTSSPFERLRDTLAKSAYLIRNCADFRGLSEGFFRVAVRTRKENEAFARALEHALH